MKRLFPLLLAVLLLCGCDLKNRKPSESFIPTGESASYATVPATQPATQSPSTPEKPKPAKGAAVIKEIFQSKGLYTDWQEVVWDYNYRLPFIDLASTAALQMNADIEKTYRAAVTEQLAYMEELLPLTVTDISYEVFVNGDILTLLVHKQPVTGSESYSAYNLNHVSGAGMTGEELITAVGLSADTFVQEVKEQLSAEFERRFGQYATTDSLLYATQQQKTLDSCSTQLPMYLDADGLLNVITTVYSVGLRQGSDMYIIRLGG